MIYDNHSYGTLHEYTCILTGRKIELRYHYLGNYATIKGLPGVRTRFRTSPNIANRFKRYLDRKSV